MIIFAPDKNVNLKDYNNIFILDNFLCEGYIANMSTKFNNIYCVNKRLNISLFNNLDCSRDVFGKIHNAVKAHLDLPIAPDFISYFHTLRRMNFIDKNLKYNQFIFFVLTMEELGILHKA
jgi:hypothetical protein